MLTCHPDSGLFSPSVGPLIRRTCRAELSSMRAVRQGYDTERSFPSISPQGGRGGKIAILKATVKAIVKAIHGTFATGLYAISIFLFFRCYQHLVVIEKARLSYCTKVKLMWIAPPPLLLVDYIWSISRPPWFLVLQFFSKLRSA